MDIAEWKLKNNSIKKYAHFDYRVSLSQVWEYISDPKIITVHGFYPFIHYTIKHIKYNKDKGKTTKPREISYSAHIDRCIFQLYSYKLNLLYNERVKIDNINNSAIAYRDNLGKCNIHFAKEAIDFIRKTDNCNIIIGDFTNFFDNLDHTYLKQMLCNLMNVKSLPNDYYAIYKNITKYSKWDLEDLLKLNGLLNNKKDIKILNKQKTVLSSYLFKKNKKDYIVPNNNPYGIPQGSAISAALSNIYMLEFDKRINDYVSSFGGMYLRYSDDFIIIFPQCEVNFKDQFKEIMLIINSIPNLQLQQQKTQIYRYNHENMYNCNRDFLNDVENGKNSLNYLGFNFDGKTVTIRSKTISKYYYRMYRKLKTINKNNGHTKKGNKISSKKLYIKYSEKGADDGKGNFLTYVKRAEKIFGNNESIKRDTKNHMKKIKDKLKK